MSDEEVAPSPEDEGKKKKRAPRAKAKAAPKPKAAPRRKKASDGSATPTDAPEADAGSAPTEVAERAPAAAPTADAPSVSSNPTERLHKFLAATGAGSRRECETFIATGRVAVNGKVVTKMGVKVDPDRDVVTLDGERMKREDRVYYLLNKPVGYICTNHDERGRPRAVDLVRDTRHRVYTVGRLDAESTGLILLTNDGAISNVVCHPRYRIEKVYQVVVRGDVTREQVTQVEAGVWLAEGRSSPAKVKPLGRNPRRNETVLEMTLFEGRNREVRRVFAKAGLAVRRLQRSRIGPLELGEMPSGAYRSLLPSDLVFVHEAERLYQANREAWDAELPQEQKRRRLPPHKRFGAGARAGKPNPARRPFGPPRGREGGAPDGGARGGRPFERSGRPYGGGGGFRGGSSGGDRGRGDRPYGDRRYGDRPQGDRPHGDRPYGARPYGARPYGDRPQGDRPQGDRPYGDRGQGDRGGGRFGGRGRDDRRGGGPWRRPDRPGGGPPRGGGGGYGPPRRGP